MNAKAEPAPWSSRPTSPANTAASAKEEASDAQNGGANRNRALGSQMIKGRSGDQAHCGVGVVVGPENRADAERRGVK